MIKDLLDLVPFLQRYPRWIKLLLVTWVAGTALFIIAFVFAPPRHGQMDFIQLLQSKPAWLQIWFAVCLLHAVAVLIGLLLSKPVTVKEQNLPKAPAATKQELLSVAIRDPAPVSTVSLEEVVRQQFAVKGRFAEEEKLRKKLHGARIFCSCTVDHVSDNVRLIAKVWIDPGNRVHESHTLFISYPESFATQAYALRQGDQIRIAGILDTTYDLGSDFRMVGDQLEFLKAVEQK